MGKTNSVEPIREQSAIDDIAEKLKEYSQRDYVLFYMGIYLGRRISDILSLNKQRELYCNKQQFEKNIKSILPG